MKLCTENPHSADQKNVYKTVENVDNSKKRRKYKEFTVNKNVRNYSDLQCMEQAAADSADCYFLPA